MADMSRWVGRVALVTGASSGIGAAIAARLAAEGMRVAICARRADRLEAVRAQIAAAGGAVVALTADVKDPAQIAAVIGGTVEAFGGVDVLVNNAGLGRDASLLDGDPGAWREMFEVNVLSLSVFTQLALRSIRARGDAGHVFHIGSMAGHRQTGVRGAFYAATKVAVRTLTEGLRRELHAAGSGVRVTAISPGLVQTEFAGVFTGRPDAGEEVYGQFPCIQPEEIADTVAFVLGQPQHMQIHDVLMRPQQQPL